MLNYFFLPILFLVGILTSFDDFKLGKIKNKWTFSAIIYALVVYYAFFFNSFLKGQFMGSFLIVLSINLVISIFVGYFLWHFNFWSAGDGKLFIAFAFLIPLTFYSSGNFNFFPSFTLLFNTFIPLGIILFIKSLTINNLKKSIPLIKKEFSFLNIVKLLISVVGVYWFVSFIFFFIGHELLRYILVLIIIFVLRTYFKKSYFYIAIGLVILRSFFTNIFSLNFLIQTLLLFFLLQIIRIMLITITNNKFIKNVEVNNLKEGMILATNISLKEGKGVLSKTNKRLVSSNVEGLTKEDIIKIKSIERNFNNWGC